MYPFRVFISYSHKDRALVEIMVAVLRDMGLEPLWDKDIHPGTPFTDAIRDYIARSHLFIPLITQNSQERPWVHQETGYALAMNIPILPIAVENQGLPADMITQLQAVLVGPNLEGLQESLHNVDLERLVLPSLPKPQATMEVADWPEKRAETMIQYIRWVTDLNVWGRVRHRATTTTFSIPDKNVSKTAWDARDGVFAGYPTRSNYFHYLQLEERRALGLLAEKYGCSLIMGRPEILGAKRGPLAQRVRLESLLDFFRKMTDEKLKIVFLPQIEEENIVIVEDYFMAESVAGRPGGWLQTIFNSHPPTVLKRVRQFDQEFEELYPQYGVSRQDAIAEIEKIPPTLPPLPDGLDPSMPVPGANPPG